MKQRDWQLDYRLRYVLDIPTRFPSARKNLALDEGRWSPHLIQRLLPPERTRGHFMFYLSFGLYHQCLFSFLSLNVMLRVYLVSLQQNLDLLFCVPLPLALVLVYFWIQQGL